MTVRLLFFAVLLGCFCHHAAADDRMVKKLGRDRKVRRDLLWRCWPGENLGCGLPQIGRIGRNDWEEVWRCLANRDRPSERTLRWITSCIRGSSC